MPRENRDYSRISGMRDPSLVIVACEGAVTERQYFEGVKTKLDENSSKVHLKILDPRPTGHSSPEHVLEQLNFYKKEFGLSSKDELCMVIDRDRQSWSEE